MSSRTPTLTPCNKQPQPRRDFAPLCPARLLGPRFAAACPEFEIEERIWCNESENDISAMQGLYFTPFL